MEVIDFKPGINSVKTCAIIVAHPSEETMWAGGTILTHASWNWFIVCLGEKYDAYGSGKFRRVLTKLKADGVMGNLSSDQKPWSNKAVEHAILALLQGRRFDLIITHSPEENGHSQTGDIGRAVIHLWHKGKISTKNLWLFAYEDNNGNWLPRPIQMANVYRPLSKETLLQKYKVITKTYGFNKESPEAKTTPEAEAFWQYKTSFDASKLLRHPEVTK